VRTAAVRGGVSRLFLAVDYGDMPQYATISVRMDAGGGKSNSGVWSMLRHLECHQGVFNPEEVAILTGVFDEAWKAVQASGTAFTLNGEAEAAREIIARRIIALALLGERDHVRLREDALLYLARRNGRDNPAQGANG
jgi:hypothetical protein